MIAKKKIKYLNYNQVKKKILSKNLKMSKKKN